MEQILAVADTANNRIMIWKSIPTTIGQPADIELGQPDFKTVLQGSQQVVDNKSLRSPQGVWIQNGKLFVADTQNHRVLIWNSIPTQNRQPADVVLGQANFNVAVQPDLTKATTDAHANTLLNPVSVSSDGMRLYVADLGNNRVLIWNSIPTTNQAAGRRRGRAEGYGYRYRERLPGSVPFQWDRLDHRRRSPIRRAAARPWTFRASRSLTARACSSPTAATTACWSTTAIPTQNAATPRM